MTSTISYDPIPEDSAVTATRINQLFAAVAVVLNNKLDVRGDTIESDLQVANGSIINVPPAAEAGDLIPVVELNSVYAD